MLNVLIMLNVSNLKKSEVAKEPIGEARELRSGEGQSLKCQKFHFIENVAKVRVF